MTIYGYFLWMVLMVVAMLAVGCVQELWQRRPLDLRRRGRRG